MTRSWIRLGHFDRAEDARRTGSLRKVARQRWVSIEVSLLCLLVLGVLVACAGPRALPSGELLVQPFPLPEADWVAYEKTDGSIRQLQWRRNDDPNDTFSTLVAFGEPLDVQLYHDSIESDAQQTCSSYHSDILTRKSRSPYLALVWLTRCEVEPGRMRTVLHLAIEGRDSFYTLRRIWPGHPSAELLAEWRAYLDTINVCDSRRSNAPCPDGEATTSSEPD